MATLEKLRKRSGLLIAVVVGLALLAFILGDLARSGRSLFRKQKLEIAEIEGKSVPINEYRRKIEEVTNIYKQNNQTQSLGEDMHKQIQQQVWEMMLQKYILNDDFDALGLGVSSEELFDIIQGENPYPVVRQLFTNPETGQLDKTRLMNFLRALKDNRLPKDQQEFWFYLEEEMFRNQMFRKYMALVQKGMYATSFEAEKSYMENQKKSNIEYLLLAFNSVSDSGLSITTSELKDYYKNHEYEYKQEASRDLKFVTIDIEPSEEDFNAAKKWINDVYDEFLEADKPGQFVNLNSDSSFDVRYYKYEELPDTLQEFMFSHDTGDVFGPYYEEKTESFKIAMLNDIKYLPDSVKARHILVRAGENITYEQAKTIADSLRGQLDQGADFAELARQNSADRSAEKGGELGWFTPEQMVKPFSDSCFSAEIGELKLIQTRFGYHIVQVTDKGPKVKKVQVAVMKRNVMPSTETYDRLYARAAKFAGQNNTLDEFIQSAEAQNLMIQTANNVKKSSIDLPGLEGAREIVRWAYEAEEGSTSQLFEINDHFVIATLTKATEQGVAPFETVKDQIKFEVQTLKKGEIIAENIRNAKENSNSIKDLAAQLNTTTRSAEGINFSTFRLPEAGMEPKVVAAATTINEKTISEPIIGNAGVYVITVNQVQPAEPAENYAIEKSMIKRRYQSRANYEAYEALKDAADIKDYRLKFY